jgi:hypothetical protein
MTGIALRPARKDPRDRLFGFHRVFGAAPLADLPGDFDVDAGLTMPDQNAAGDDTECTAYTVTDMAADQDGIAYEPDIQYAKTLLVMGARPDQQGADLRAAFKSGVAFGFLPKSSVPEALRDLPQEATSDWKTWPPGLDAVMAGHRKPAYFPIAGPYDFFDNVRSAMRVAFVAHGEKRPVGMGTPWYAEFGSVGRDGILEEHPEEIVSWHAYKVSGFATRNSRGRLIRDGEVFLKIKAWQGRGYGDGGYVYMSRSLASLVMRPWGTYAGMYQDVSQGTIEDLKAQRVTLLEVTLALAQNLLMALRSRLGRIFP